MNKLEATALWLTKVINGCYSKEQVASARRLVENFQSLYDDTLPLMRWVLQKEFEIINTK